MADEGADGVVEDGRKDEKIPTPTSVHIWHKSLKGVRWRVLWQTARVRGSSLLFELPALTVAVLFICISVLAFLSLYWGVRFDAKEHAQHLPVWVVDFDGLPPYQVKDSIVGDSITYTARKLVRSPKTSLHFIIKSPAEFNYNPLEVRKAVYAQEVLAAIIANPNATSLLV